MLTFMILVGVALLLTIVVQLGIIIGRQRAINAWLLRILCPKEYSFHEERVDEPSNRSVIDQLGVMIAQIDKRAAKIDGMLQYLRSYVWEVLDGRYIDDIRNPPASLEWERRFTSNDDPAQYGLWMRERDMAESFQRDVVIPVSKRRREREAAGESDEPSLAQQAVQGDGPASGGSAP
jgi:hypothetical protein